MGCFKKVTAKTPEDAASEGLSSMTAFFKPVPRPAPAPPVNKRGRRALTAGLRSFQVVPKSPGGTQMIADKMKLFDHMVQLARRTTSDKVELCPSGFLDVQINNRREVEQSRRILNPRERDYVMGAIMVAAGGSGGTINQPKRKLDAMIGIRGHCCFLNDEKHLKSLTGQLDLAESIAEYTRASVAAKKSKKEADVSGLFDLGPAALLKLREKSGDVTKITKKEMCAIASRYFSVALEEKNKKELLVAALQAQIAARPGVLPACVLDAAAIAAAAVVAATATAAAAADSDYEGEE